MKTLAVAELKARFSDVLREVEAGNPVTIEYGRARRKVAVLVPSSQYTGEGRRSLGVLQKQGAAFRTGDRFAMTDEDLLAS